MAKAIGARQLGGKDIGARQASAVSSGITGTLAQTLSGVVSASSGSHTAPVFTGSVAATLDNVVSAAAGTSKNLGELSSILSGAYASGAGVFLPHITGTGGGTLSGVSSTSSPFPGAWRTLGGRSHRIRVNARMSYPAFVAL